MRVGWEIWFLGFLDHRHRLFGPGARCAGCGTSDVVVLVVDRCPLVCRRCELLERTGRTTELHHFGGRPSAITMDVDANRHAWLTLLQRGWRGSLAPGSFLAIVCDQLLCLMVCSLRLGNGTPA